jgi:hypothetical protein
MSDPCCIAHIIEREYAQIKEATFLTCKLQNADFLHACFPDTGRGDVPDARCLPAVGLLFLLTARGRVMAPSAAFPSSICTTIG